MTKRSWTNLALLALAVAAVASPAGAQEIAKDRFALGVGVGLVEPDTTKELYATAALRIRLDGGRRHEEGRRNLAKKDRKWIQAWLEPEIGANSISQDDMKADDVLVGINFLGVMPLKKVETFIGIGVGVHFLDVTFDDSPAYDSDDSKLGANIQSGLDYHFGDHLSLFGLTRLDFVDGDVFTTQFKLVLGLRFGF